MHHSDFRKAPILSFNANRVLWYEISHFGGGYCILTSPKTHRQKEHILTLYHIGLIKAPLYLGDVLLVPGVSIFPFLFGIAISSAFIVFQVPIEGHPQGHQFLGHHERHLLIRAVNHGRVSLAAALSRIRASVCPYLCSRPGNTYGVSPFEILTQGEEQIQDTTRLSPGEL